MPGVFEVLVGTLGSVTSPWAAAVNGVVTDPAVLADVLNALRHIPANNLWAITDTDAVPVNKGVSAFVDQWSVDGGALIPFSNLPAGFVPTSARIEVSCPNTPVAGDKLTVGSVTAGTSAPMQIVKGVNFFNYPAAPSAIILASDKISFTALTPRAAGYSFNALLISGAYTLLSYSWSFPQDGMKVSVGDLITITSPGTDPLTDLDLSELTISLACGVVTPIIQTKTLFTFLVPAACNGNGLTALTATGNGVQFSGAVPLGSINILLINASGIYTLVAGKTHDTLYTDLRDGTTKNVKIPNPFAKTGYIGG